MIVVPLACKLYALWSAPVSTVFPPAMSVIQCITVGSAFGFGPYWLFNVFAILINLFAVCGSTALLDRKSSASIFFSNVYVSLTLHYMTKHEH